MLRQSTAAFVRGAFRIQRNAWFDTGYIQSGTLLSCGGEGFSPDDAYGSTLDSVMPMKGKHTYSTMSMDLADPVSNLKYSGIFVFTAPVAEPTLMSFTVPLNGSTIVATATIVTSYSSSTGCLDSAAPMCCGSVCVEMSCGGGGFTRDGAHDFVWDSVRPMTGKYTVNYFQYQEDVGCVCMLNGWFSSNDEICADNYIYSRFMLKDKCRSEKWEVRQFGDKTIKVERAQVQFLDSGDMPVVVTTGHGVQTCRKLWFSTIDGMSF